MIEQGRAALGCDPEGFLAKDGFIIGAEKVISDELKESYGPSTVKLDGVQLEFAVQPGGVEDVIAGLARGFSLLYAHLSNFPGVSLSFVESVDVRREELASLSPTARELGCQPSLNIYTGRSVIDVPPNFPTRSAGGHVHLGLGMPIWGRTKGAMTDERRSLVPMLDWVVGNTCVLLNRGEAQRIRRKTYGRAGEYRLPQHGLEYRTLSNFWLRDPLLADFVFSLSEFVVDVLSTTLLRKKAYDDELMMGFDVTKVRAAIDGNDLGLALENFAALVPFLEKYGRPDDPLNAQRLPKFVSMIAEPTALDKWFPVEKAVPNWLEVANNGMARRWTQFLDRL